MKTNSLIRGKKKPVINSIKTGENIKNLLKEKNLSCYSLAEMLSISQQAISKWVNGTSVPTTDNIIVLMTLLDVDFKDILAYD